MEFLVPLKKVFFDVVAGLRQWWTHDPFHIYLIMMGVNESSKTSLTNRLKANSHALESNLIFHDQPKGGMRRFHLLGSGPIDGIIYVIDTSNLVKLSDSKGLLHWLLDHQFVGRKVPVLVLAIKEDDEVHWSEIQLRTYYELPNEVDGQATSHRFYKNSFSLFMCSMEKDVGYEEGIKWLVSQISTP